MNIGDNGDNSRQQSTERQQIDSSKEKKKIINEKLTDTKTYYINSVFFTSFIH